MEVQPGEDQSLFAHRKADEQQADDPLHSAQLFP